MSFKIGDVVWIYTERSHDPKYKMCAIIAKGITEDTWLVSFICSEAPKPPKMNKYYIPLQKNESTPFLEYDSFLNCWDPVEFPTKEIEDSLKKDKGNHCGPLAEGYLGKMIEAVNACPQIEMRKLLRYFE